MLKAPGCCLLLEFHGCTDSTTHLCLLPLPCAFLFSLLASSLLSLLAFSSSAVSPHPPPPPSSCLSLLFLHLGMLRWVLTHQGMVQGCPFCCCCVRPLRCILPPGGVRLRRAGERDCLFWRFVLAICFSTAAMFAIYRAEFYWDQ